jgi:hypothetical protein
MAWQREFRYTEIRAGLVGGPVAMAIDSGCRQFSFASTRRTMNAGRGEGIRSRDDAC